MRSPSDLKSSSRRWLFTNLCGRSGFGVIVTPRFRAGARRAALRLAAFLVREGAFALALAMAFPPSSWRLVALVGVMLPCPPFRGKHCPTVFLGAFSPGSSVPSLRRRHGHEGLPIPAARRPGGSAVD